MDVQGTGDLAGMLAAIATSNADECTTVQLHGMPAIIARFGVTVGWAHGKHLAMEAFDSTTEAQIGYLQGVAALREHQALHLREIVTQTGRHRPLADLVGQPVPDYPPAG